jgi:Fur family peroxide stress response transcriptional regulator
MRVSDSELARRLERFETAAREAGLKLTHQRLEIFREVASTEDHPDAETVFRGVRERVPTVSLDTVYRTLWLLEDLGLIATLGPRRERTRFDANLDSHHHFVCENCGLVRDFEHEAFDALELPPEVKRLGSVSRVSVEVRGVCRECAGKRRRGEGSVE